MPQLADPAAAAQHRGGLRHDADGAIGLEDRQPHVAEVGESVLTHRHLDLVASHPLTTQSDVVEPTAMDQDAGHALEDAAPPAVQPERRHATVDDQQHCRGNESASKGGIGSDHGVLDSIGHQQQDHQVEHGHLPELALAHQAQTDHDRGIDDEGTRRDFQKPDQVDVHVGHNYHLCRIAVPDPIAPLREALMPDVRRYQDNLQSEVDGAHVYAAMAAAAAQPALADLYARLAAAERRHADLWRSLLREAGADLEVRPSWRARVLATLARRFGPGLVAPTMGAQEFADRGRYDDQREAAGTALPDEERSHARLLSEITGGGIEGGTLARFEGRHRAVGGNALRAAVLGANDGLVSNFSLVMGVAGAAGSGTAVIVAGSAGLLAGALSMALGEWLSVQSARELYANQLRIEGDELAAMPREEEEELRLIYQAKGIAPEPAADLAHRLVTGDRALALDTLAREELGLDPDELGGSPWVAATTSFALFAGGAAIPLAPFMITGGPAAIIGSALVSGVALFGIGAGITVVTGRSAWRSGLRSLGFGLAAAAVTYGIGTLVGGAVGL
jgi:VIT1/CCC1 family predicted Fe2+/Mn2+ transporter